MPKGRPKKPTALKLLQGTARPDRMPDNPVDVTAVADTEPPKPPPYLKKDAKKLFIDRAEVLHPVGLLTEIDVYTFAAYCSILAEYIELEKKCRDGRFKETYTQQKKRKKTNEVYFTVTALSNYRMQLINQLQKYETKFGLTPSDRDGISLNNPEDSKPKGSGAGKKW
jgi:P27 family predicted phage terminase small subunit